MSPLAFTHRVIDDEPPGSEHDICLLADINGDGNCDIIIGGKKGPANLFWYENPSWKRHFIARSPELEAGGVVVDINRDGRPDIVVGQQIRGNELYWFECPGDPMAPWTRHVIDNRFEKYHDQAVGDVDGDGQLELMALSQVSRSLFYYDIPADPYQSPWPADSFHLISADILAEGLLIVDLDGDGQNEIMAGTNLFSRTSGAGSEWERRELVSGYKENRVKAADLDGDGRLELVIAEAETYPARLAWCKAPLWRPTVLKDDLFHAHTLEVADFDGDGLIDILVAEMGLGKNPTPQMIIYRNLGGGRFEESVISSGIPTHEAKVADLTGNGLPDIVGKPYNPERHIDVWFNNSSNRHIPATP